MSWNLLRALLLSLLPSSFWLWYVVSSAPRRPSRSLLIGGLAAGALSPLPVLGLGWLVDESGLSWMTPPEDPMLQLVFFIVSVGLVEELAKLVAVRATIYNLAAFQEPWDGLMGSTASALGFATVENVKYVLGFGDPSILLGRSLLSTLGHVLMSAPWGYALGLQKREGGRHLFTLTGWLWAGVAHGFFDWFLSQDHPLYAMGVLLVLLWVFRLRISDSVLESRYHRAQLAPVCECPACRALVRQACSYCTACGRELEGEARLHCGNCLQALGEAQVCPQCGTVTSAR